MTIHFKDSQLEEKFAKFTKEIYRCQLCSQDEYGFQLCDGHEAEADALMDEALGKEITCDNEFCKGTGKYPHKCWTAEDEKLCPECGECDNWIECDNNGKTRILQCEYCGHKKEVGANE